MNTPSTTKHDLVADLLSNYEVDAIGHINMSLDCFVDIYKEVNKLPNHLQLTKHSEDTTTATPIPVAPPQNTTLPVLTQPLTLPALPNPYPTFQTDTFTNTIANSITTTTRPTKSL